MKIYIAGKITGLPEREFMNKFLTAEMGLTLLDFTPVNPTNLPDDHDKSWKSYMKVCLNALKDCPAVLMLNCWEDSRGARVEHWFAKRYNKTIIYQPKEK